MSSNSTTPAPIQNLLSTPTRLHGVTAISVAGLLSVLSVLALLGAFAFSSWRAWGKPDNAVSGLQRFLRSALGLYLVSTLVADAILGGAYVIGFHWVAEKRVYESGVCQLQAGLIQVSDFATGLSTLALSIHTFLVLVPMRPPKRKVAVVAIPAFWLLSVFTAFIGPAAVERNGRRFYGPVGSWCYIDGRHYEAWRFILLYDLIWATMVVSLVCYVSIFLSMAGVIRTTSRLTSSSVDGTQSVRQERRLNHSTSRKMLLYPFLYLVVFLPISVTRILNLCKRPVPAPLVIFAGLCLASSGTVNAILFVSTRWSLLSNFADKPSTEFCTGATSMSFTEAIGGLVGDGADRRPSALPRRPSGAVSFTLGGLGAGGGGFGGAHVGPLQALGRTPSERHLSNDSGISGVSLAKCPGLGAGAGAAGSDLVEREEGEDEEKGPEPELDLSSLGALKS